MNDWELSECECWLAADNDQGFYAGLREAASQLTIRSNTEGETK